MAKITDWRVDTSALKPQITQFKNTFASSLRAFNPERLVEVFKDVYGLSLSAEDENVLSNFFSRLPTDLRLAADTPSGQSALITQINLLPLIKQAKTFVLSDDEGGSAYKSAEISLLNNLEAKIAGAYIAAETQGDAASSSTVDRAKVYSESYVPPVGRFATTETASSSFEDLVTTQASSASGDPLSAITENMPGAGDYAANVQEIDIATYLRQNPTVNDLAQIAKQMDSPMFEMGSWDRWLNPGKKFVGEDADGNSTVWSATDAINYLFALEEKGDIDKIKAVQNMLRKSGYFSAIGAEGTPMFPTQGIVDEQTLMAWNIFLTDAARSNRNPQAQYLFKLKQLNEIRSGKTAIPSIDDPEAAEDLIQQIAGNLLGRTVSPGEISSLMKAIDGWRREAMTLGFEPSDPGSVNFNARIENYLEEANQKEIEMNFLMSIGPSIEKIMR